MTKTNDQICATVDHRFAHQLFEANKDKDNALCVIVENAKEAKLLKNELNLYLDATKVDYFPENEILPYDHFSVPESIVKERFKILNSIDNNKIIISTVKNLFEVYPKIDFFKSRKSFNLGNKLSIESFEAILKSLNYLKVNKIDSLNQYSLRGGIVDVYSPIYSNPLRIEIFDDSIESIRLFDVDTQLSIQKITEFNISKGSISSLDESGLKVFKDAWREYFQDYDERDCEIFQKLNNKELAEGSEIYHPLFFQSKSNFFELFSDYKFIINKELSSSIKSYSGFIQQRFNDENIDIKRPLIKPDEMFIKSSFIENKVNEIPLFCDSFSEYSDFKYKDFDDFSRAEVFNNLKEKRIILMTSITSEYEIILKKYLPDINEINFRHEAKLGLNIMLNPIIRPLINIKNAEYIAHREYFLNINIEASDEHIETNKYIEKDIMFKTGDLVVHEEYGLGRYDGLEIVTTNEIPNEYIKIIYSGNESLYVPLRSVELITKFHKTDVQTNINYDSLSSNKWLNNKNKAAKRAYDHAAEILDIESRRQASTSSVLRIDDESFEEFNKDFPYIETPDQVEAINSIKKDISLIKPMNRVLCGDVGFGKTEVAMRSAYISIHSNKQVIILCPSTVLSDQHYESFLNRYKNFPVNIKLLNRHSGSKNKTSIVSSFNNNEIDILIGTHALFTSGIDFSNVGLLIVDEEHKFGIKQKDLIKSRQENIHILYLSATPIPRTMNFIFSGLKEFSFLHSPPVNRISIKSFLKIHTNQLIKEAITREISRGGQCFIVQNDISKIENLKNEINKLLPEITIGIAHGQLNKTDISKVMTGFDIGEVDVLICTTIVEMGLDIPNANTIVIIDAQNFGLSQLHQLRGRVGRSSSQGYCYFLIPTPDLSKIAKERLDSIIRLSALGSGFFIAQEDLEIRGGGEMLGDKQSGHINTVGINLYLSMLKSALNKFKSNNEKELIRTEVNFYDSSYISDTYLPSALERLKIYKSINSAENLEELNKVKANLEDRCGSIPEETLNLINNAEIGLLINSRGIKKVSSNENKTSLLLSPSIKKYVFDNILTLITNEPNIYSINKDNRFIIDMIEPVPANRRRIISKLLNDII